MRCACGCLGRRSWPSGAVETAMAAKPRAGGSAWPTWLGDWSCVGEECGMVEVGELERVGEGSSAACCLLPPAHFSSGQALTPRAPPSKKELEPHDRHAAWLRGTACIPGGQGDPLWTSCCCLFSKGVERKQIQMESSGNRNGSRVKHGWATTGQRSQKQKRQSYPPTSNSLTRHPPTRPNKHP